MSLPEEKKYSYADLLTWEGNARYELIEGVPMMMSPPLRQHQEIVGELFAQLYAYLKGKRCKVYPSPFAVRLFEQNEDFPEDVDTLVEPDITVVCNSDKLDTYGCKGAPDLAIEVLSPSNRKHDKLIKLNLYQRAGVKEYWIVDPDKKLVLVHTLDGGQYPSPEVYTAKDTVPVGVLEDCSIDLTPVFSEE